MELSGLPASPLPTARPLQIFPSPNSVFNPGYGFREGTRLPESSQKSPTTNSFRSTGPREAICFWKSAGRMRYPAPPTGRPKRGYHVVILILMQSALTASQYLGSRPPPPVGSLTRSRFSRRRLLVGSVFRSSHRLETVRHARNIYSCFLLPERRGVPTGRNGLSWLTGYCNVRNQKYHARP
jgi:hypothetical protein